MTDTTTTTSPTGEGVPRGTPRGSTQTAPSAPTDGFTVDPSIFGQQQSPLAGTPYIDPQDVFGGFPGADASLTPVNAEGQIGPGGWQVDRRRRTANEMVRELWRMSAREVEQLQVQLYRAGFYDDQIYQQHLAPSWGVVDETTQEAFYQMLLRSSRYPEQTIDDLLRDETLRNRPRLAALQTRGDVQDFGPEVVNLPEIRLSDPATLRTLYRAVEQSLTGRELTDDERQRFADAITGEQRAQGERAQAQVREAAEIRAAQDAERRRREAEGPEATPDEVGAFTRALTETIIGPASAFGVLQNTGLNRYGLEADTIRDWASEARAQGVAVPALSSPQAVDLVVDWKVRQLYRQFDGDWQSVATSLLVDIDSAVMSATGPRVLPSNQRLPRQRRPSTPADVLDLGSTSRSRVLSRSTPPVGAHRRQTVPAENPGLSGLAGQLVASMGQSLGRYPGTQQPNVEMQAPIYVGGGEEVAIDPQARAEEQIRRERGQDVYDFGLMQQLNALEAMVRGG